MKEILNEEWLRQVLEVARDCRMRQLEKSFEDWEKYREAAQVKEKMFDQLEKDLLPAKREILNLFDEAYSLMLGGAQDYFYENGFADCFRIFGRLLAQQLLELSKQ